MWRYIHVISTRACGCVLSSSSNRRLAHLACLTRASAFARRVFESRRRAFSAQLVLAFGVAWSAESSVLALSVPSSLECRLVLESGHWDDGTTSAPRTARLEERIRFEHQSTSDEAKDGAPRGTAWNAESSSRTPLSHSSTHSVGVGAALAHRERSESRRGEKRASSGSSGDRAWEHNTHATGTPRPVSTGLFPNPT